MFKFLAHDSRLPAAILGTLGTATLALLVFTSQVNAASLQQLQQLADNAALAGVNTLGTSEARAEADRRENAIQATKQMIAAIPGVEGQITASVQNLTVTVKLSSKTGEVASTARYVAPDQPSNWAWASRQHFAVGRTPVVVGSTCVQGCGADRLR
jgi:hypothetical protein